MRGSKLRQANEPFTIEGSPTGFQKSRRPMARRRSELQRAALWAFVTMVAAFIMPERLPAATPRWVQLPPPAVGGPGITTTLYDSRRQRELVISYTGSYVVWAVSGGPRPSWTYLGGPPPGVYLIYDAARDRLWAFQTAADLSNGGLWSMDLGALTPTW